MMSCCIEKLLAAVAMESSCSYMRGWKSAQTNLAVCVCLVPFPMRGLEEGTGNTKRPKL